MTWIRTWGGWIRSVFCRLFLRRSGRRENDLYVETLTEYLIRLSNRPRSLSLSRSSSARLLPTGRKRGLWKGKIASLTEAYTFLLNLPGVSLSRVEYYRIADRLVYQVRINRQMVIMMREHTKGFHRWADLTLLESKKPRLHIRLCLCEVETHELVSPVC